MTLFALDSMLLGLAYTDEYVSRSNRLLYHKISYTTYDSKIDGHIADFNYNYEAYNEAFQNEIIFMIKNHPVEITKNVVFKMIRYLGWFDYHFEMTYDHNEKVWKKYPIKAIYSAQWFQYVFYILIALYGYILYRRNNRTDIYQIFFIGNTLVYFFIEAYSTYRFISYFYILFLVGYGMSEFNDNYIVKSKQR